MFLKIVLSIISLPWSNYSFILNSKIIIQQLIKNVEEAKISRTWKSPKEQALEKEIYPRQ
jgi:hypothetical protein